MYTVDEMFQTVTLKKLDSFDIIISNTQTCVVILTSFGLSSQIFDMCDSGLTIAPWFDQHIKCMYYKTVVPYRCSYNYVALMIKYL